MLSQIKTICTVCCAGLTLQLQVIVWRAAVTDGGRGEAAVCRKVVVVTELCSELSLHVGGRGVDGGHLLELREVPRAVVVGVALGGVCEGHGIGRRREPGDLYGITFQNISMAAYSVMGEPEVLWGMEEALIYGLVFDNVTIAGDRVENVDFFQHNEFVLN